MNPENYWNFMNDLMELAKKHKVTAMINQRNPAEEYFEGINVFFTDGTLSKSYKGVVLRNDYPVVIKIQKNRYTK